jgi:hypothetical protein
MGIVDATKLIHRTGRPRPRREGVPRRETAFPVDTSAALARLTRECEVAGAVHVSFRELVPWIRVGERATHYLHSYPAKLLPQIAHFFLAASSLASADDVVLDPFGGTGTVALETVLSGRKAYFADSNPLARLIAAVKTAPLEPADVEATLTRIQLRYKLSRSAQAPDVVNIAYWYDAKDARALARLRSAIERETSGALQDFFMVAFSAAARKLSKADPRFSVPVRRKNPAIAQGAQTEAGGQNVWGTFEQRVNANLVRLRSFMELRPTWAAAQCTGVDARKLTTATTKIESGPVQLPDNSVGLIITSPPYAGAQKYIRASGLSLGWLGLTPGSNLRSYERQTIGREHLTMQEAANLDVPDVLDARAFVRMIAGENKLRAAILATYLREMEIALVEAVRVLRPGGHIVLVIGDNKVLGRCFKSAEYLSQILADRGLTRKLKLIDDIKSRGLITKRASSAGMIATEWVILFEKTPT